METKFDDDDTLAQAFWKFHMENPTVYEELVKLAKKLKRAGRDHYGIKALFEIVRFHRALETTDPSFKLNNNFHALYARHIMSTIPELDGFFHLRTRLARVRHERTKEALNF